MYACVYASVCVCVHIIMCLCMMHYADGEDIQTGQEGLENMSVRFRHPAQQASVNSEYHSK